MAGAAIAHQRAAVPKPPGFLTSVWDVFVAFLVAAIGVAAAALAAVLVGVLGFTSTSSGRPDPIDWPFAHAGSWSIAANVVATAAVLLLCAVAISRRLARRATEPVSWLRVFAIVALTGYAPFAAYHGLLPFHFFFGLLATAFLARRFAVGVPGPEFSRRASGVLFFSGAALLLVPVTYGATHPLWYGSYVASDTGKVDWRSDIVAYSPRQPSTITYGFTLKNASWRHATILGITGGSASSYPFLRVVRAEPGIAFEHRSPRPVRGYTIGHEQDRFLTLYIRTFGCDSASGTFTLDSVDVRYRLAGLTLTQPVPLATRPTVVCP
jgi:hypothetical protein